MHGNVQNFILHDANKGTFLMHAPCKLQIHSVLLNWKYAKDSLSRWDLKTRLFSPENS